MVTKENVIQKGFEFVGNVGEYEWFAKKTPDDEYLYHVVKDGTAIYQYPKSVDIETIEGILLIKSKLG